MSKDILKGIIDDFNIEKFQKFFRSKSNILSYPNEQISGDDNLVEGKKLVEGTFDDGKLIVCSFKVLKDLTERSGKKAQYILGKKILKEQQADAGIFIFYDSSGNFRFSLIYTNYLGKRRDWSSFKRFTYFVSKDFTNKTFLNQIGDADFSTIEKIKEAFSVEPVTKQFYAELQNWYYWAMDKVKFPEDYKYNDDSCKDKEKPNATNLIRLITRIIFIWFLKEKELIPPDLFSKEKLKGIVRDFLIDQKSSNFYNAILQNLFFATLNQKMNNREFVEENSKFNKPDQGIKNKYRYSDKFNISKDEVLNLFKDIPFLNGGLFDCLDKYDEEKLKKGIKDQIFIDGFTRDVDKQAIIPDYLFFQENEERVDLSKYGLGKGKPVRGLIEILNSYNFTIDENTPVDQEIALDPELLGKVFENLLASYNPETATTARKATGSYYTPREIVDYMVEASLSEYLKSKFPEIDEEKIKTLLSYSDEVPEFSEEEKQKIISSIADIKILDPACGSGAFPMGILHKLVFVLQKLDPENKFWYELQFQKALKESEEVFKERDKKQREERLKELNETFDENVNYPDYARKLYLIENCIFGVDIQTIAIQISKLRFFISLVLDQKIDRSKDNYGVRALPNLETRFVAANTLLGIEKPKNLFYTDKIRNLEDEIKFLRHKYFQAKTRKEKLDYQKKDKNLRELLAKELKEIGFSSESSEKIAKFDMFDQNASADWFDPEWMFGVTDGFDIVIANPPYIRQEDLKDIKVNEQPLKPLLQAQGYEVFNSTSDIYTYFYEKGYQVLKEGGLLCFISSNKWMRAKYGEKLRKFLKEKTTLKQIIDFNGYKVFAATVDTNILLFKKTKPADNTIKILNISTDFSKDTDINTYFQNHILEIKQSSLDTNCYTFGNESIMNLKAKIEKIGIPLKDWDVKIYRGLLTGLNDAFIIDSKKREEILANCKTKEERKRTEEIIKPILRGRDIGRYYYNWAGLWIIKIESGWTDKNRGKEKPEEFFKNTYNAIYDHLISFKNFKGKGKGLINRDDQGDYWWELRDCDYYPEFEKEKIVYGQFRKGEFAYDNHKMFLSSNEYMIVGKNIKYLLSILNSKIAYYYQNLVSNTLSGQTTIAQKSIFINIPIPKIPEPQQQPFIDLVDKILAITKDKNYLQNETKKAKVKELEDQIDQLVYELYNLTEEEIKIIEGEE